MMRGGPPRSSHERSGDGGGRGVDVAIALGTDPHGTKRRAGPEGDQSDPRTRKRGSRGCRGAPSEAAEATSEEEEESEEKDGSEDDRDVAATEKARRYVEACGRGDVPVVRQLLEGGDVDVNARRTQGLYAGSTALILAAGSDNATVVELLMEHGADVNARDEAFGRTALDLADDIVVVALLLHGAADPNVADCRGFTPLHGAVVNQRVEKVQLLLEHGASVDCVNENGDAPIHLLLKETAGRRGGAVNIPAYHEIAQLLVLFGTKWDDTCDGLTDEGSLCSRGFRVALLWWMDEHTRGVQDLTQIPEEVFQRGPSSVEQYVAALHASDKIVLRRKVCVVGPSFWGKTSLVKSISEGQPSLEHPEDRTIGIDQFPLSFSEKALSDEELLMAACRVGNTEAARWLVETNSVVVNSAETGAGGDKSEPRDRNDSQFSTPLHFASENGHLEIVQMLLASGANPNVVSELGYTALHLAIDGKRTAIVEALLAAGADPNIKSGNGDYPLHLALRYDFPEGARLLLRWGAHINVADEYHGDTPLHYVSDWSEMTTTLLEAGANVHTRNQMGETAFHKIVRGLVICTGSGVDRDSLSAIQQAAQALVSHGVMWDEECDDIVEGEGKTWQAVHEAVAVWMEEHAEGTQCTTFPFDIFARGPSGIRQFVAESGYRGRRSQPIAVSDTSDTSEHSDHSQLMATSLPSLALQQSPISYIQVDRKNNTDYDSQDSTHREFRDANTTPSQAVKELNVDRHHEVTFWDFAGQEAYQVAHSAFFSKRTLYLICVDLQAYAAALEQAELRANKDSDVDLLMEEFVESKILRWIRLILARQPDAEFVFVGTKADVLVRTTYRIDSAREDLKNRVKSYAASIESKSCDLDARFERCHLDGSSSSMPRTMDRLCSRALSASAKRLHKIEWLAVNCKNEDSVTMTRTAIEQIIIRSKRSFQMPDLYSQVLRVILKRRTEIAATRPSNQVKEAFWDIADLSLYLELNVPELTDKACQAILRTLHDVGDVLWFEDLGINYLKNRVILHPLVLIEFVRQVVHHNHTSEVMTHAELKERPFWDDLDPERMLVIKQLLQRFHLVHPVGSEMKRNSDLIVPAFWRSKESALWLFLGDTLKNDPTLQKVQTDLCVQWEYHFTTALPDVMFDELVIESYLSQYERQAGPDWILYKVEDRFACRVVVTRAPRTLERVLRFEAIASESAPSFMWGRFEHLCESLERVLRRYKGMVVSRFVVDNKATSRELDDFVEDWMRTPPCRREPKPWLPPSLDWYYDNVMKARDEAQASVGSP